MARMYIAGNWKMNKTISESVAFAQDLKRALSGSLHTLMVAPPFTALEAVAKALAGSNIMVGAQNMGPVENGAHTGEVSVHMLKDAGVRVVILGHSERRKHYLENDSLINTKLKLALAHGMLPILCVGETIEEREGGLLEKVIAKQIEGGLKDIDVTRMNSLTIAYEPVWAIGTGRNATPQDAVAVHTYIRTILAKLYNDTVAKNMCIQYGGSVNAENASTLLSEPQINGALVGGASLKLDSFAAIVNAVKA